MSGKAPDTHLETLTPWAKSDLGREFQRKKFHIDPEDVKKGAHRPETVDTEIQNATSAVRTILDEIRIPSRIAGNYLYEDFLTKLFPEPDEPIDDNHPLVTHRNILPLVPYQSDLEQVDTKIDLITQEIFEYMIEQHTRAGRPRLEASRREKAKQAIKNAVYILLDQNLRRFDNYGSVAIDPNGSALISTRDVRKAVRATREGINAGTVQLEDADFHLLCLELNILGHVGTDEFRDPSQLNQALLAARRSAIKFYEQYISKSLLDAQIKFKLPGERISLNVDEENKEKGLFELLDLVINSPENSVDLGTLNEAQILAYLTYRFFLIELNNIYREAKASLLPTMNKTRLGLFGQSKADTKATIYYDPSGNIVPYQTDSYEVKSLRTLNIPGFEDLGTQHAFYDGWDVKDADSIVAKQIERPQSQLADLPDLLRGTVVTWNIGKKEIDHNNPKRKKRYREYLVAIGHQVGESLGLTFNPHVSHYRQLQPGEYFIDSDKLDSNPTNKKSSSSFRVVKFYGKTANGLLIEFQILPRTTYEDKLSQESPSHDSFYKYRKAATLTPILHAESITPRAHEVSKLIQQAMRRKEADMFKKLQRSRLNNPQSPRKKLK